MRKALRSLTLVFFLGILAGNLSAQKKGEVAVPEFNKDSETGKVTYKEVVEVSGTSTQLYEKGLAWFNTYYKSPTSVIKEKNPEKGQIKGFGRYRLNVVDQKSGAKTPKGQANYDITISFKDGKYRYEITNIIWKQASRFPMEKWISENEKKFNWQYANYLIQVDEGMQELIDNLKAHMAKSDAAKSDDW